MIAKLVPVISGGLDSTTLLYKAISDGYQVDRAVSFNYGQRHKKELEYAKRNCERLSVEHTIIDLWSSGLPEALSNSKSSLISNTDVPEGHYAEESMKQTVVPNRNMMMISIALAIAVADEAQGIAIGVHAGDHFIYPDCRTGFLGAAALAGYLGNEGFGNLWRAPIWAPFIHSSKADIAYTAFTHGVVLSETWSCYKGEDIHCGRCGTCVERLEAIAEAQIKLEEENANFKFEDTTHYADTTFWEKAVAK